MRSRRTKKSVSLLISLACLFLAVGCEESSSGTARAAEADGPTLNLQTERVIVFKDGYALVLKRGAAITDEDGAIFLNDVPDAAVLGSFWATPDDGRLMHMVAGWTELKEESEKDLTCTVTIEVLKANVGKTCTLQTDDDVTLSGTILTVLTQDTTQALPATLRANFLSSNVPSVQLANSATSTPAGQTETISGITGSHFVLRTEAGDVLLAAAEIHGLTVEGMKTTLARKVTTTKRTKRLTFNFEKPGERRELLIAYFRPGIRWIPTYRIDVADEGRDKMAEISMQAELLNEAEDLIDTPIDIVVGVPNFRFRDTPSPLILESSMRNALQQTAPQLRQQFALNNFTNSAYGAMSNGDRNAAAVETNTPINLPGELTAGGSQDLFIYNLPKLKLKKGERAAVPIFAAKAPYRDVFTWDVQIKRTDIAAAPAGKGVASPLQIERNEVWRQIELTNTTKLPWTTGAAMIMEGNQPLAQEMLTYTSNGDRVRIPVTIAVDVRGTHSEEEVGRELRALQWRNNQYALINQRASLSVCNHKSDTIDMEISMQFGGKADKASDEGTISLAPYRDADWRDYQGDRAVNNSSKVRWKATLKPGQIFAPTVDYHFYTRH